MFDDVSCLRREVVVQAPDRYAHFFRDRLECGRTCFLVYRKDVVELFEKLASVAGFAASLGAHLGR